MALASDFLPLIWSKLPDCPEVILEEAVRESAIEFCKRTHLLIDDVTVNVRTGTRFYYLFPPSGLTWVVNKVVRDGAPLTPTSRVEVEESGYDSVTGRPMAYYLEGDGRLTLAPVPNANETLTAKVVVRPDDTATDLPDALYSEWAEPIAAGAVAFVRRNYQQWADVAMEAMDASAFEAGIAKANIRRINGAGRKEMRVRYRAFGV